MIRSLLISAASLAAFIIPAEGQALDRSLSAVTAHSSGSPGDHRWGSDGRRAGSGLVCDSRRDHDRPDRRGALRCATYGEGWGYYDPQVNRSWDSDSYNDWW